MARIRRFLLFKSTAVYAALLILTLSVIPSKAGANFIPSSDCLSEQRSVDFDTIQTVLESKMVAQRLGELGYTSEETMERLAKLPDQELHRLATNLETLQSGGNNVIGFVLLLIVAALVLILILELTGHNVIIQERGTVDDRGQTD